MRYGSTTLLFEVRGALEERDERIKELEAENKRLREALVRIALMTHNLAIQNSECPVCIAEKALEQRPGGGG